MPSGQQTSLSCSDMHEEYFQGSWRFSNIKSETYGLVSGEWQHLQGCSCAGIVARRGRLRRWRLPARGGGRRLRCITLAVCG